MDNPVLEGGMQAPTTETYRERELRTQIKRFMETWGTFESIQRLSRRYGKANTLRGYLADLDLYFRWLRSEGVAMNPDELIKDNLKCVYSGPEQVATKRRHTDWLDRYANVYLLERGDGYSSRHRKVAAIRAFYHWNDSDLFGAFSLLDGKTEARGRPLSADDIREVMKSLPIEKRAPLLLMWQTGAEPSAVLALKWGEVALDGAYIKLDFAGRKRHKREYFKIAGRDSINLLKIWREEWKAAIGREPMKDDLIFLGKKRRFSPEHGPVSPGWLNQCFKETGKRLYAEGLVKNGTPDDWHIYQLRHSFSTECSHAEVKAEVREFWMGHISAISWVYQHPELHEQDFVDEYRKVEPYVSLSQSERAIEERVKSQFEARLAGLEAQMQEYLSRKLPGVS
jgi:integrase